MNILKSDLINNTLKDSIYKQFSTIDDLELCFLMGRLKSNYIMLNAVQARFNTIEKITDEIFDFLKDIIETIISDDSKLISQTNKIIDNPDVNIDADDRKNIKILINQYSEVIADIKIQFGFI